MAKRALVKRDDPMREVAIVSQNELMQVVSQFGNYIDDTGATATSERGLVVSINKAIKLHYGLPREDMPRDMLLHVASLLDRIINLIDKGMKERKTRQEIKRAIRETIRAGGESYKALNEVFHAYH